MEDSRVITRGLQILEFLTDHNVSSVSEIARALSVSPAAVHRVLESLRKAGYVRRAAAREPYRLTLKASGMARRLPTKTIVANVAEPVLRSLAIETGWPVMLGAVEGLEFVVIEAVRSRKPSDISRFYPGQRIPAFKRPAGVMCIVGRLTAEKRVFAEQTNLRYGSDVIVKDLSYLQREYDRAAREGFMIYDSRIGPSQCVFVYRTTARCLASSCSFCHTSFCDISA